jgi:hypothetical protein
MLLLLLAIHPGPASGQMACVPFKELIKSLRENSREVPVSEAIGADGRLWVTFAEAQGATWTLAAVDPRGTACLMMIGKGFSAVAPDLPGQPS